MKKIALIGIILLTTVLFSSSLFAGMVEKSRGQVVVAGVGYTNFSNGSINQSSSTRITIRNIDPDNIITVTSIKFYNPDGVMVLEYLDEPIEIGPLASKTFLAATTTLPIPPYDKDEGRPCFIVEWQADTRVMPATILSNIAIVRITDAGYVIDAMVSVDSTVIKEK